VPTPTFDVTARVAIFAVRETFAEVAETLVVLKLLENQAFPPTVRFAPVGTENCPKSVNTVVPILAT
jgi:hypothetical protein